jgi:hypothetical protein
MEGKKSKGRGLRDLDKDCKVGAATTWERSLEREKVETLGLSNMIST